MPSCFSNVKKAVLRGRLSVCLFVTGLIMVILGAIFISFSSQSNYQFALIGVGADILLIVTSVWVDAYIKVSKQSSNSA